MACSSELVSTNMGDMPKGPPDSAGTRVSLLLLAPNRARLPPCPPAPRAAALGLLDWTRYRALRVPAAE